MSRYLQNAQRIRYILELEGQKVAAETPEERRKVAKRLKEMRALHLRRQWAYR